MGVGDLSEVRTTPAGQATRPPASQLSAFVAFCEQGLGRSFRDHADFHEFSVSEWRRFCELFLGWSDVIREGSAEPACVGDECEHAAFFPRLRLNYAENLLRVDSPEDADAPALVARHPSRPADRLSRGELRRRVVSLAGHLYAIAGYSLGALIAFEIARRLSDAGEEVEWLGLIDPQLDHACLPTRLRWKFRLTEPFRVLRSSLDAPRERLPRVFRAAIARTAPWTRVSPPPPEQPLPPALAEFSYIGFRAFCDDRPRPYDGGATCFTAADRHPGYCDSLPVWRRAALAGAALGRPPRRARSPNRRLARGSHLGPPGGGRPESRRFRHPH